MLTQILSHLPAEHPWRGRIQCFDTLPSTNTLAKELAKQGAPHGTVLIADHQTSGRGRLGRTFHSPGGTGIYMSVILRPNCPPEELMHLTCAAGAAMCDAVDAAVGIRPGIKWINDLVWQSRKLGGILTELVFTPTGALDSAVVGIGINCTQGADNFPPEIRQIACSLAAAVGQPVDRALVAAQMILALERMDPTRREAILQAYRADCVTLGKPVQLLCGDSHRDAVALDIDAQGALVVKLPDGSIQAINSGEVSVRGLYGYV